MILTHGGIVDITKIPVTLVTEQKYIPLLLSKNRGLSFQSVTTVTPVGIYFVQYARWWQIASESAARAGNNGWLIVENPEIAPGFF